MYTSCRHSHRKIKLNDMNKVNCYIHSSTSTAATLSSTVNYFWYRSIDRVES